MSTIEGHRRQLASKDHCRASLATRSMTAVKTKQSSGLIEENEVNKPEEFPGGIINDHLSRPSRKSPRRGEFYLVTIYANAANRQGKKARQALRRSELEVQSSIEHQQLEQ